MSVAFGSSAIVEIDQPVAKGGTPDHYARTQTTQPPPLHLVKPGEGGDQGRKEEGIHGGERGGRSVMSGMKGGGRRVGSGFQGGGRQVGSGKGGGGRKVENGEEGGVTTREEIDTLLRQPMTLQG